MFCLRFHSLKIITTQTYEQYCREIQHEADWLRLDVWTCPLSLCFFFFFFLFYCLARVWHSHYKYGALLPAKRFFSFILFFSVYVKSPSESFELKKNKILNALKHFVEMADCASALSNLCFPFWVQWMRHAANDIQSTKCVKSRSHFSHFSVVNVMDRSRKAEYLIK